MSRTSNKIVKPYALVKLYCNKYNKKEIPESTPTKQLPRLLVVKVHEDTRTAIVKYPSGIVNRVGLECINVNSIINTDNPKYKYYCIENTRLVEHEAKRNDNYKDILTKVDYPFIIKPVQVKPFEALPKVNEVPTSNLDKFLGPLAKATKEPISPKQNTNITPALHVNTADLNISVNARLAVLIAEQQRTNLLLERLCRLWESDKK